MSRPAALLSLVVLFFAAAHVVGGMQLTTTKTSPCAAYGNGTQFDISTLFTYPVLIGKTAPKDWYYHWNPCAPVACRQSGGAVCQKSDQLYMSGALDNAVWQLVSEPNATGDGLGWQYKITYANGFEWRMSTFHFTQDPSLSETTVTFIAESPYLEYQFDVRGPCVGAPNWGIHSKCQSNPKVAIRK